MPAIEESIVIDRPRDDVFAFATDPANIGLYNSNMAEYEQQSEGARGKGTVDRGVVKVAGKKIAFSSEITEWLPTERVVVRSVESPVEFELTQSYEDADGGTRVTWHQETPDLKGFFGKIGDAIAVKMYARDVKSNLENLKIMLEER